MRLPYLLMLVTLSVIWGSAFMLTKTVLEDVPPLTLVAGRLAVALVFLSGALVLTGKRLPLSRRAWTPFVVLGVVNNIFPFTLLAWGQQHIDSSLAAILVASMPLSTVVLAHFWIGERLTLDRIGGVLVGFAGVFLLIGGDLRDVTESSTLGQLAIIIGTLGYSAGTVYARRYLQDADPNVTAAGQMLIAASLMGPVALVADAPFDLSVSLKAALAWATLGCLASGIAYLIFFRLIRHVTATQASMVGYLIPITGVLLGTLVLDERLAATTFAGLALIILGVWVVNDGARGLQERLRGGRAGVDVPIAGGGDG